MASDRAVIAEDLFIRGFSCPQLLGYDIGKPKEHEMAKRENLFHLRCPLFVRSAVELVEQLLEHC